MFNGKNRKVVDMNKRIKILLITEAMLGGIRQHVLDIVYGLDVKKYEIYLAYSENRADEKFYKEYEQLRKKAYLICCKKMQRELNIVQDFLSVIELGRIIINIQPDIVHCHSSKAGIVGRIAACMCGVKHVYYTPNAYSFQNPCLGNMKRKIYIMAERFLSKHMTTKTISVSQGEMKEALKNKVDKREKFVLIYNGIPNIDFPSREELRKELGFKKEQILIGVTARLAEQKDPMTFLAIAKQVIKQDDRVHFVYIGNGEMEQQVKDWIKQNSLSERVHMLGFRSDASVLVSMLDIYLSTALYEGLPYSVIEAMRAGIPIIATDVVGNNELVEEGVNGLLFPARNVEKGVETIMEQIRLNTIKRKAAVQSFEEKYSSGVMLKKLNKLFGGVMTD